MDFTKHVNIDVGTDSEYRESNGNTLPNVQYPFGNQAYVFQTNKGDGGWFYKPRASYTEGIRVTNQPSPWLGDYGHITLLPFNGQFDIDLHTSISRKSHSPFQMQAHLNRYDIDFKLTPTKCGAYLVADSTTQNIDFVVDCHDGKTSYTIDDNILYLTVTNIPDGEYSNNYRKYYTLHFSEEIKSVEVYKAADLINSKSCQKMQLVVRFDTSHLELKLASSYISHKLASTHIERELNKDYQQILINTKNKWNELLGTIEVTDSEEMSRFYSNLYRCFCYPRIISEINERGNEVYYNFKTQKIDDGTMISDVGFWDVYRTTMPLYKLIIPSIYKQFISAILNYYVSYEWLPRWLAPFERGIMPSTLIDSVVASAIIEGDIPSERIDVAIEALLKNADKDTETKLFGRECIKEYKQYGFVPRRKGVESVSLSLDNYYCDYAIYKALDHVKHERTMEFYNRSQGYKYLFNPLTRMFESVSSDGKFSEEFSPYCWGVDFCESSAVQNNFNLVHDKKGFIQLFDSEKQAEERLDMLFNNAPNYDVGRYGYEIHEMTEYAKIRNLGHFAISNQPSFILPFWYIEFGSEEKFKEVIGKTLEYFTDKVDGYPGDEDNGSLSAWYIFVMIGKYPFCPVDGLIHFDSRLEYKINAQI